MNMITECLKEGISLTNRNWQLVLLRIAVTVINLIGFVLMLGVPAVAAVVYLGMDLAHIKDLLPVIAGNPFEFISRYLVFIFLLGTAFIFYLLVSSLFYVYAFGGMLGALKNSAVNIQYRFSLSSFFREANKYFSRLFWLISISISLFTLLAIVVIISAWVLTAIASVFTGSETLLDVFFSSFAFMSIIVFGALIVLAGIIFITYSMVALVIEGSGVMESIKKTFIFLKNRPGAFLFYISLFIAVIIVNTGFFFLEESISMLPLIAPLMGIFMAILSAFLNSYIAVAMWSSLIAYYLKCVKYPVYSAGYEI